MKEGRKERNKKAKEEVIWKSITVKFLRPAKRKENKNCFRLISRKAQLSFPFSYRTSFNKWNRFKSLFLSLSHSLFPSFSSSSLIFLASPSSILQSGQQILIFFICLYSRMWRWYRKRGKSSDYRTCCHRTYRTLYSEMFDFLVFFIERQFFNDPAIL
jgi:hypothetical protein